MNAIRRTEQGPQAVAAAVALPMPLAIGGIQMREKLIATRDTLLVLAAQLMFRTMLLFRAWLS